MGSKAASLEKAKIRLTAEFEDLQVALERANVAISQMDKKQRAFDSEMSAQVSKYEEVYAELELSQKTSRSYQTEIYKLKGSYEESVEAYETLKREHRTLQEENAELADQLTTGGKSLHEISKAKKKAEAEADELKSALEEAEGALELEESRVLRLQLELTQVKAEVDKKLAEKDEEFDSTRKNHARAVESMQATLDVEVKARSDAARAKKNLETSNADLEMQLDITNKNLKESGNAVRRLQGAVKEAQDAADAGSIALSELQDQFSAVERKAVLISAEYDEVKSSLEINERARKAAEAEALNAADSVGALTAQNSSLGAAKRKLESELDAMKNEHDDAVAAAKSAEDKAKKAIGDAAKMSEDVRSAQHHLNSLEKVKKALEGQVHELTIKLDDAEAAALKGSRKALAAIQSQMSRLESDYEAEVKHHADTVKNYRKAERKMKELTFQADEDAKNNSRMSDLVSKLLGKLKQYKIQCEEAEGQANDNLAKFRKANNELSAAEERADAAESALSKMRSQARSAAGSAGGSSSSYSISRKTVFSRR